MTAAFVQVEPKCPQCGGYMWNQKGGKYPWKPGTPIWKCKDKECAKAGGVIWEPKTVITTTVLGSQVTYAANKPNAHLPPLLQNQEAEDAAELAGKIGPPEKPKLTKLYLDATEFVLEKIVCLYEAKEIGVSDQAVAAMVATVFIAASKER